MREFNFKKYPNKYFVETGTQTGQSVERALEFGCFEQIYSIELMYRFYVYSVNLFMNKPNVKIILGDSTYILPLVLNAIDAPATFWLDGHYSGPDTAKGESNSPILRELEAIKNHPIKTHTILIDDANQFGLEEFDYVSQDEIVAKLLEINPNYEITMQERSTFPDQVPVLVAHVKG
ncbi:MAG: hypothetical protein JSS32_09665 [Verrucomicrobia bacterium]|nr:hypothetical protein [Verrucomicrobiota bacterium]